MSLSEIIEYDKAREPIRFPLFRRLFLALVILLVALLSFGAGRLVTMGERPGVKIEYSPSPESSQGEKNTASALNASRAIGANSVVASKNSDKYHYGHCPGAKQIKEENRIVFKSAQEAEMAGYTLAGNCR